MRLIIFCPTCGSDHIVKNGHIHNGKQKRVKMVGDNRTNIGFDLPLMREREKLWVFLLENVTKFVEFSATSLLANFVQNFARSCAVYYSEIPIHLY
jgi:hypothetical protein